MSVQQFLLKKYIGISRQKYVFLGMAFIHVAVLWKDSLWLNPRVIAENVISYAHSCVKGFGPEFVEFVRRGFTVFRQDWNSVKTLHFPYRHN